MKLWTIQSAHIYDQILKHGVYRITKERSNFYKQYTTAYDWMVCEMQKRLPPFVGYKSNLLPIWAWVQFDGERRVKPDLKTLRFRNLGKGTEFVRIEFYPQESEGLLSDFNLWQHALNSCYLPKNKESAAKFYQRLIKKGFNNTSDIVSLPAPLRKAIIDSWILMFDLDHRCNDLIRPTSEKSIQATLWELRREWIWKIDFFEVSINNQKAYK